MSDGIFLTLTHTNIIQGPVYINDGSKEKVKKFNENFYVPFNGSITIPYSSTIAFSYESGSIKGFVDAGYLTSEFSFGPKFTEALETVMPSSSGYWQAYGDSQYTDVAPLVILGGASASLSIDNLGFGGSKNVPPTDNKMWDPVTNTIQTSVLDAAYTARISLTARPTQINTVLTVRFTSIDLGIDFVTDEIQLSQSAGVGKPREIVVPWFNGTAVTAQGALVTIETNSDVDIYDMGIFIMRNV